MSDEANSILQRAMNLPPDERFQVAQELLNSLGEDLWPADPEHDAEITRRSDEAHAHPERLIPWEQARQEIEAELERRRAARQRGEPS